jgi:aminopeptidase N
MPAHVMAEAPAALEHAVREALPSEVVPVHYDLHVSPDADALTFNGRVSITVDVRGATPAVVLNASGLVLDRATLDGAGDAVVSLDPGQARATLRFAAPLAAGRHALMIDYHGKIGRSTLGFFAMDYASPAGARRTLATNFEPASAREFLPCWDEPGRKATFTMTVDAPKDRMAISNMPVAEITPLSPAMQRVRFAETPKMSTYLLFLSVGDFERVHRPVDGVDVGVVVKRGDTDKAGYALDQAGALLHYYNGYFGVNYPLPKLDLIAAPGQIAGGSMENWGAIFYSQHHLLFDERKSTESDRQLVFTVVAHEMAHQWFGDLVTMSWWDDLWLNEGFARWMQSFAADDLHPEWETGLRAATISEAGKQEDSVPSTHPVVQRVLTAEQAGQSFDSITYAKGAAVITMLNAYVGRDRFRDGVRRYMRAHAFGNTVDSDLWSIIQSSVGMPILSIERDFTRQEGLPLVRVTHSAGAIHLAESRFADDPSTLEGLPPQRWRLPLSVGPIDAAKHYILLKGAADLRQRAPLLVNAGQSGYARVLYGEDLLSPLAQRFADLAPIDQLGLLNDAIALAVAGDAPASDWLRLAVGVPAQANLLVWQRVIQMLDRIERRYADSPSRNAFHRFALDLLAPLATRLRDAASDESSNAAIVRSALMVTQGQFGDAAVIARAREIFESGAGTPAERRSAMSIVAAGADATSFEALLASAQKTEDPLEKQHILEALASVGDPSLAGRLLDVLLSNQAPAGTLPQLVLELAVKHPDLVWSAIAPRLDDPALPFDKLTRWRVASGVAGSSADRQRITDLESYETRSVPEQSRKPFLAAIAAILQNERFRTNLLPQIDRWIAANRSSP